MKRAVKRKAKPAADRGAATLARQVTEAPRLSAPKETRAKLADWLKETGRSEGGKALKRVLAASPKVEPLLTGIADGSPFLWDLVAADPARFRDAGTPWQASRIYQGGTGGGMPGERVEGGAAPVSVATNVFDPALGMSWAEFGSIARTAHKCQGTSQLASEPGEGRAQYLLLDSEPKLATVPSFLPDDVSVRALARFAAGHESSAPFLAPGLAAIEDAANAAVAAPSRAPC